MNRTSDDLTNYLSDWLRDRRRELDELKTSDQVVGPDSVVMRVSKTAAVADISTGIGTSTSRQWRITFTPSSATGSYADLMYDYSIGGGNGTETVQYWPDPNNQSNAQRVWRFGITTSANAITLTVKFAVKSIDSGAVGVTAL